MIDLLLIESFYNNNITDEIIDKYKNNILFCYIDYYNMKYILEKYNVQKYYSFLDIADNIKSYHIINYYNNDRNNKYIIQRNDSKNIITFNNNNRLTWIDSNKNYTCIYLKDSYVWNIKK